MTVIKLGGSLFASGWIKACLETIVREYRNQNVVIVPGGGIFADQVRKMQKIFAFDDSSAHAMAVLAMQQTAWLIKGLHQSFAIVENTDKLSRLTHSNQILIWSPDLNELNQAGIKPDWTVTSDSLSAWLAKTIGADELILIKSVTINADFDVRQLTAEKVVDASFEQFILGTTFKISVFHAQEFIS